jgi:hypothetical protein
MKTVLGLCWAVVCVCAVCSGILLIMVMNGRIEPMYQPTSLAAAVGLIVIPYIFTCALSRLVSLDKDDAD